MQFYQTSFDISGAVIKNCICTREMIFTPKDFSFTCDIEALAQKIKILEEQSHANYVSKFNSLNLTDYFNKTEIDKKYALKSDVVSADFSIYPTIDNVNQMVVENYVQKRLRNLSQ